MFLVAFTLLLSFQSRSQTSRTLKEVIKFEITEEGGANGAAVAWHPGQKKYYAAMAGNKEFPLVVLDAKGKKLFDDGITTQHDVRGLWYNPFVKALQTNGYDDYGWGQYELLENGKPGDITIIYDGMLQPTEQSVGAYDAAKNLLYFLDEDGSLAQYNVKSKEFVQSITLNLGKTKKDKDKEGTNEDVLESYNSTALIFTGIKGSEIGVLNIDTREVELYNIADGYLVRTLKVPDTQEVYPMFNFSYTNGIFFFFDKETRVWKGYR